jgi:hypothetical protein
MVLQKFIILEINVWSKKNGLISGAKLFFFPFLNFIFW